MTTITSTLDPVQRLLDGFSLEITGKDVPALESAHSLLPPGTPVNVTFLRNEEMAQRVAAARRAVELGFRPVPHLSARRLRSRTELSDALSALQEVGASEQIFAVGGDPAEPEGPFEDALALIRSGELARHGVRAVGITGYPEGHPHITDNALWKAMADKISALREQSLSVSVTTQFGFDAERVVAWTGAVRDRGVDGTIRVGVPGPAGAKRLISYARRFGVESSAGVVRKYGLSLTQLMRTVGPDAFVSDLAGRLDRAALGDVRLHFYTFGGVEATADWVRCAINARRAS